jgi:hypothetical protein
VVKSYIIDSKAYKLLVLIIIVLLAFLNSVRKGRGLQGKQRWNSSIKGPGVNNVIKRFLGGFFRRIALLLDKVLKAVFGCLC